MQDVPDSADLPPCHGLLAARSLQRGQALAADEVEHMLSNGLPDTPVWLHFDLVDVRAQRFLAALPTLPLPALQTLHEHTETTHLDVEDDAVWGTIPDFQQEADDCPDPAQMSFLHFVLTPTLLITARRHPLRAIALLGDTAVAQTPAGQWDRITRQVLLGMNRAVEALNRRLDDAEDRLLQNLTLTRDELAGQRRAILLLNRRIEPVAQRYADLVELAPDWLSDAGHDVTRVVARLEGLQRSVSALQERGRIAQDQLAARTAEETNQRLMVLSVLTAILLPPTLVTGFFGMNTTDLPGTASPGGIWWASGAMLLAAGIAVLLMVRLELLQWRSRRRRH